MKRPLPHDESPTEVPAEIPAETAAERWTVDGLEDSPGGRLARLERADGTTFTLPLTALPTGLREGDVLAVEDGPDGVSARVLAGETRRRRARAQARLDALNTPAQPGEEITL